jgi:hypothetical protein
MVLDKMTFGLSHALTSTSQPPAPQPPAPIFPTSIVGENVWLFASLIRIILLAQWCPHYKGPVPRSWSDEPLGCAYALREQQIGIGIIRTELPVRHWAEAPRFQRRPLSQIASSHWQSFDIEDDNPASQLFLVYPLV